MQTVARAGGRVASGRHGARPGPGSIGPARGDTTAAHGRVLDLQRRAGNRAVSSLLSRSADPRAQLQRTIGIGAADLGRLRSGTQRLRGAISATTYDKIIDVRKELEKAKDPKSKLFLADVLAGVARYWLDRHAKPTSKMDARRKVLIEDLHAQAQREASKLRAEAIYLKDLEEDRFKGVGKQFTKPYALPQAKALAAGKAPGGFGADQAAADLAAAHKLTAAELAAIRIYTLPDYVYINPATANADAWMSSNVAKAPDLHDFKKVDPKVLKGEGALQAGMLMQALAKLDAWEGDTFRGSRATPEGFAAKYAVGSTTTFTAFGSSAKIRSAAQEFADGKGGDTPPGPRETVSVMCEVALTNGRDISALSAAAKKEDEVLILPGASFTVVGVERHDTGPAGSSAAPATAWYTVRMKQTA